MVGQIRRAIGEIVRVEEWKWVDENYGSSNRDQEGNDRVARCIIAIASESSSQRMLRIKDRCFCCSATKSAHFSGRKVRLATYPRNGYKRYQIIEAGLSAAWPAIRREAVPTAIAWSC